MSKIRLKIVRIQQTFDKNIVKKSHRKGKRPLYIVVAVKNDHKLLAECSETLKNQGFWAFFMPKNACKILQKTV